MATGTHNCLLTWGVCEQGVLPPRTQAGADGQPQAEGSEARSPGASGEHNESLDDIEAQLQLDAINGVLSPAIYCWTRSSPPDQSFPYCAAAACGEHFYSVFSPSSSVMSCCPS